MARKTKQERLEESQRMMAEEQERLAKEWMPRLMRNLERSSSHGMAITAKNGMFIVNYTDSFGDNEFVAFTPTYTSASDCSMDRLEMVLADRDYDKAEFERKAELRKAALAKLTAEEREELGI